MGEPCSAKCRNQRHNRCQLEDEQIQQSRVEFGDEWEPEKHCARYLPSEKSSKRQRRK